MVAKLSTATKAIAGAGVTLAATLAAAFGPDTDIGKWCVIVGAVFTAIVTIYKTKNTQIVDTSSSNGPVIVSKILDETGDVVGELVADTGEVAGGIVQGTTGILGGVVDATLGKLIPGKGLHAA